MARSEFGDRIVIAREIGLAVAYEIKIGHKPPSLARKTPCPAPPPRSVPALRRHHVDDGFGHKDPFVGVMKGQVLCRFPAARLVDLTHEILAHWPAEAGFWLGRSFRYFPPGTVHVAVVDPGVGSSRNIAVVEAEGQLFLAPDNGLLAGVLERLVPPPSCDGSRTAS